MNEGKGLYDELDTTFTRRGERSEKVAWSEKTFGKGGCVFAREGSPIRVEINTPEGELIFGATWDSQANYLAWAKVETLKKDPENKRNTEGFLLPYTDHKAIAVGGHSESNILVENSQLSDICLKIEKTTTPGVLKITNLASFNATFTGDLI